MRTVLCTAANETYALGGAIALASALRRLEQGARVYVLDGGIRPASWAKLEGALRMTGRPFELVRLLPDLGGFSGLPKDWGSSVMTYARLTLPVLVNEERLLYLDADMVVQADASSMMTADLDGAVVGAARDPITSTLAGDHLPLTELGLPPDDPYLQAGLLLIDLPAWRSRKVSERIHDYLRSWPNHAKYWDQSAINVVLHRNWRELPSTWNVPAWWADLGKPGCPLDAAVLHYVGPNKPWLLGHHRSSSAARFFAEVDLTPWRGWRPSRLRQALKQVRYQLGRLRQLAKR